MPVLDFDHFKTLVAGSPVIETAGEKNGSNIIVRGKQIKNQHKGAVSRQLDG
jgi:hypothetical protein